MDQKNLDMVVTNTTYGAKVLSDLIKDYNLKSNSRILDVGCGRGDFVI